MQKIHNANIAPRKTGVLILNQIKSTSEEKILSEKDII